MNSIGQHAHTSSVLGFLCILLLHLQAVGLTLMTFIFCTTKQFKSLPWSRDKSYQYTEPVLLDASHDVGISWSVGHG